MKLQPMLTSQSRNKLLIRVRLGSTQFVIEMNNGENDAEFTAQFNQQPQAAQPNQSHPKPQLQPGLQPAAIPLGRIWPNTRSAS